MSDKKISMPYGMCPSPRRPIRYGEDRTPNAVQSLQRRPAMYSISQY